MTTAVKALQLIRHLGPRWAAFRVRYALRKKTGGLMRSAGVSDWSAIPRAADELKPGSLFDSSPAVSSGAMIEADGIIGGRFPLFSFHKADAGLPPEWARNQLSGERVPHGSHWSTLGDFAFGDIKGVWELSRFGWAFSLGRAYAQTRDNRFAEAFWTLFEDWCESAKPNCGPNWMCGQEATFRLMAATFGRHVCAGTAATTAERVARFRQFVYVTGRRVAANIDYALSQSNNHGISECVGLITASVLLPGVEESEGWRRVGLSALEDQLDDLVYADGGFAQHSATYHRVLLQDLLWVAAVMQWSGDAVPVWLTAAGRRAGTFIHALLTPETGRVPLYGPNDGANILPLADADYLDFRPTVQAAAAIFFGERWLARGPWDEMSEWLAPGALPAQVSDRSKGLHEGASDCPPRARHFTEAGCLVWRAGDSRLFFRCPTHFKHRPSQADLLHVDVEWRGQPIAQDAGTYSYNTSGPFRGSLKEAVVHNSITFDQDEPMQKAGRFLYLPWPKGGAGWDADKKAFSATHDGWERLGIHHRRTVCSTASDSYTVRDSITSARRHTGRLHWLLADLPHSFDSAERQIVLQTEAGPYAIKWDEGHATLVRAAPDSNRGWWSPYYYHAAPALSLAIEFEFSRQVAITTTFAPL